MEEDSYRTIVAPAEAVLRERGSRFLAYAYPIEEEDEIKRLLDALRKRHYDATHHCYAWRIGPKGALFRANDDGEPSGTAGKPILGQMLSKEVTDLLVVVVRYFGGTKLGVPGLIAAYRESAVAVLEAAQIEQRTVDARLEVHFSYLAMNDIMKTIKEIQPKVIAQKFDNVCTIRLAIRQSREEELLARLEKCEDASIEHLGYK
ncbi:IMPACT family protein [Gallalistipes aquisgranensis]|uniref:IMPACT family protein n=1 Tax=Gallalistipes aquisgranensis TaxID=2779358 RepID=UPI001CF8B2A8|nr:YigZ family protein [Gallalistipes aquisgranensis]MBE5032977.1 YigZ family protein [Gallalistipes aquisgranensis]